ncbi:MAG: pyridoxal phosphate-dependent aminotransferase [Deltaproteobacteria bacterium]|nr:pyridoxal phosphate-dependent aminotransferase [Deltaproteobacteria bacterium]
MSTRLAKRLDVVQPSATLAVSARAAALKAQGRTIYPFGVGEPDFDTPVHIRDAAKAALDKGATRYTAVSGTPELKKAVAEHSARTRGVPCEPSQVVVGVGAKHVLFNLALALYEPGDEVIIPAPYWVSYPEQVRLCGAEAVILETSEADGFRVRPDALEKALNAKTKAVILCTPSNPTGSAYPESELRAICEVMAKHDAWLIVDEIYSSLVYDGFRSVSALTLSSAKERVIVVDGVSKTYAMTGWRIGWSITPPHVAKVLDMVQSQSTTNAAAVAQAAAVAAITGTQEPVEQMRARFEARRDLIVKRLNEIPGVKCRTPEGAFYAFADLRGLLGLPSQHAQSGKLADDLEIAKFLLEEAGCAAVPGSAFGAPGYMRFSYATSEENIEKGLAAAKAAVEAARAKA